VTKRTSNHVGEERAGFQAGDRFTFDVTDEAAARALRERAVANGRSVEAELDALVRKTYAPQAGAAPKAEDDDWVHALIRIANGAGEGVFD
jgi:plasmid stability protein